MNKQTVKTLKNINRLYEILGSWQQVANEIGVNRATVNKWFAGTRKVSHASADAVAFALDWYRA